MVKSSIKVLAAILWGVFVVIHDVEGILTNVGTFGTKRYWMETGTRYQEAAADYCRNLGYSPVQFDSEDELEFLSTRLEPSNYWTAGIEIGTLEQYNWVQPFGNNPIAVPVDQLIPYQGIYLDRFDNSLKIESIHTSMRPLCQEIAI